MTWFCVVFVIFISEKMQKLYSIVENDCIEDKKRRRNV